MYKIGVSNKATSSLNKKPLSNKIPNKSHSITPKEQSKNSTEKVSKKGTSGNNQSEDLINFTKLNFSRMKRGAKNIELNNSLLYN